MSNNPGHKFPRRTSVTPAASSYARLSHDFGHSSTSCAPGERKPLGLTNHPPNNEQTGFNPGSKLRRMSTLFSMDKARTREVIMAALEDPARTEFRKLKHYNEHLTAEWKQLRKFIEQLNTDYESTRQLDPIRRYKQLQAMTKRTVMHLRLTEMGSVTGDPMNTDAPPVQGSVVQSEVKERELEKRIMQLCDSFTVEELGLENRRLRDQNERLETRIHLIVQTINELDVQYRSSKRDSFLKRYSSLRDSIKQIITNSDLTDNP
ncbi:hypothetical protein PHET_00305 [Paragonimus heterotremus]|uniref:Uncharacterized protein n=1 Tax=Paragonimus heterotremus TaxID=100268 RepID=A0A8J4WVC7_9TREM|nr:hypothetical protein PHET_00305 [Paragonimus heterotremus]